MSDTEKFADFVASERARLIAERDALRVSKRGIDDALAEIEREFVAIDAYAAAKRGKASTVTNTVSPRGRRLNRRNDILAVLDRVPDGLTRSDIVAQLGVRGDRTGESSVSNALTNMVKAGTIGRDNHVYYRLQNAA